MLLIQGSSTPDDVYGLSENIMEYYKKEVRFPAVSKQIQDYLSTGENLRLPSLWSGIFHTQN